MKPILAGLVSLGLALAAAPPVWPAEPPVRVLDPTPDHPLVHTAEFLSPVYTVDKLYRSMMGPQSMKTIRLVPGDRPELIWVTGYRAEMVKADGTTPQSQEFMCHSNLDINMPQHLRIFDLDRTSPNRVFTLSQGQQTIRFPEGFGIPIVSLEAFRLTTQVLNLNRTGASFDVRHKVSIEYIRDADLKTPLEPLFQLSANAMVLVEGEDGHFGLPPDADPNEHGTGCLVGTSASDSGGLYHDQYGRRFSAHWQVKPGREVNHTNVTHFMNVPFDTTIHYIAVHLHPFAESLELRDLTTGETLYHSKARPSEGRIGLSHVDYYSSAKGLPIYKSHEYELVSVYNNTTDTMQDSMAVMYLYALDKEYKGSPIASASR